MNLVPPLEVRLDAVSSVLLRCLFGRVVKKPDNPHAGDEVQVATGSALVSDGVDVVALFELTKVSEPVVRLGSFRKEMTARPGSVLALAHVPEDDGGVHAVSVVHEEVVAQRVVLFYLLLHGGQAQRQHQP